MVGVTGRRILIVEDEMLIALMLQSMLEALGHHVAGRAKTAAEALSIIEAGAEGIDAATLDINLAGQPSYEVADALKEQELPYIVVSGYDDPKILAAFHGRPVVHKPIMPRQLEQAIQSLEQRGA